MTTPDPKPWTVHYVDGMWEVTCSDGSLGGRFLREGDARVWADVAGPGPLTVVSKATLDHLRALAGAGAPEPVQDERPEDPARPFRYEIEVWYPQLDGSHTWETGKATPSELASRLRHEAEQVEIVGSWTFKAGAGAPTEPADDMQETDHG